MELSDSCNLQKKSLNNMWHKCVQYVTNSQYAGNNDIIIRYHNGLIQIASKCTIYFSVRSTVTMNLQAFSSYSVKYMFIIQ